MFLEGDGEEGRMGGGRGEESDMQAVCNTSHLHSTWLPSMNNFNEPGDLNILMGGDQTFGGGGGGGGDQIFGREEGGGGISPSPPSAFVQYILIPLTITWQPALSDGAAVGVKTFLSPS